MLGTNERKRSLRYLRNVMVVVALIMPTLSLVVLGMLWLWQNNYLLLWAAIAACAAVAVFSLERWLVLPSINRLDRNLSSGRHQSPAQSNTVLTESERDALVRVESLAENIEPSKLTDRASILALGLETVEAVAHSMHPGQKDPLWRFTVPEALALVGQVNSRLNKFVVEDVPLGDQLTVGQLLTVYRWRSVTTVAEKAYDVWRILRFINPATAIAGELREKISGELIKGMRSEFTRRVAQAYVREVGRAAVDLYSGRLRPDLDFSSSEVSPDEQAPARRAVRLLVLGQQGVGKSSTINALSGELRAAVNSVSLGDGYLGHVIKSEGAEDINLVDSPALIRADGEVEPLLYEQAARADAILWVLSVTRPDRSTDAAVLGDLRTALSANKFRPMPPMTFVLTHIDQVRPFQEWSPPYDLADPASDKSRSIRAAIEAVADDMQIDSLKIVPIMTKTVDGAYNIETLWANVLELLPAATNLQLARALDERARAGIKWGGVWRQAMNAGLVVGRTLRQTNSSTDKRG
ncbi:MAG: GTPase domain-containing protein [Hyphomicrobiaceae bacterium]